MSDLLRFFVVAPPVPPMMTGAFAVTVFAAGLVLMLDPVRGSSVMMPVLVPQLFAAASGFAGPAGRGHYDLLLTSWESRLRVAAAHWRMSIVPGTASWLSVALMEMAATLGVDSAALASGTCAAMFVMISPATPRCRASSRGAAWGTLGNGDPVTPDRRRIRALSRGTRQLLGLRTALGRHPLGLIALDEPWEALDPDAARWLSTTIETKRDRGAAVILSSHRLNDLAGFCDTYLFLLGHRAVLLEAHEVSPAGPVTAALLGVVFDSLRGGSVTMRAVS